MATTELDVRTISLPEIYEELSGHVSAVRVVAERMAA